MKTLAVILALMVSGCVKSPSVVSARSSAGIINGTVATSADKKGFANSTVFIFYRKDAETHICSGSLIAPKVVLTAAHCFHEGMALENFSIGFDVLDMHQDSIVSGRISKVVARDTNVYQRDIALVFLTEAAPTSIVPAKLPPANLDITTLDSVFSAGYGMSADHYGLPHDKVGAGTLRWNKHPINEVRLYWNKPASDDPLDRPIVARTLTTSICSGDSGGPLFAGSDLQPTNMIIGVNDAGGPIFDGEQQKEYQAAVLSGTLDAFYKKYPDAPLCLGGMDIFVNLAPQIDWINQVLKVPVDFSPRGAWRKVDGH